MNQSNSSFQNFSLEKEDENNESIKKQLDEIIDELKKMNENIVSLKNENTTIEKVSETETKSEIENNNQDETIEMPKQNDNFIPENEEVEDTNIDTKSIDNVIEFPKTPEPIQQEVPNQTEIPTLEPQQEEPILDTKQEEVQNSEITSDINIGLNQPSVDNMVISAPGVNLNQNTGVEQVAEEIKPEITAQALEPQQEGPSLAITPDVNIGQNTGVEQVAEKIKPEIKAQALEPQQEGPSLTITPDVNIGQNTGVEQVAEEIKPEIPAQTLEPQQEESSLAITPDVNISLNQPSVENTNEQVNNNIIDMTTLINNVQSSKPIEASEQIAPAEVQNTNNLEQATNDTDKTNLLGNIEPLNINISDAVSPYPRHRSYFSSSNGQTNLIAFGNKNKIDNNAQVMTLKQAA